MRGAARPRGRLFRKYVVLFALLVSGALLTSGLVELYFSYRENLAALVALQREQAAGAAARIEAFVRDIERQVGWASQGQVGTRQTVEQRRFEFIRLQRQAPAVTEVSQLDRQGREQLRVSRLAMDVVGSGADFSGDPRFKEARPGRPYFGPVYFRKESEPYLSLSVAGGGDTGVTVAEVNLKFIWDVVSQIRIGTTGRAYVVDGQGQLVAHPDISLVLQKTDLSRLEQVRAVLAGPVPPGAPIQEVTVAKDSGGRQVLTASAPIAPLGWWVFVEQPIGEGLAPLYASAYRTIGLLLCGVALSVLASLALARRMTTPIHALEAGAARIGAGALDQKIDVKTGDELEGLADQFNRMAAQLQESYATLERKVEDRTRELSEALEQQTTTAEILRVISSSPTDIQPVLDAVAASAARLCDAPDVGILRLDRDALAMAAHVGPFALTIPPDFRFPITRSSVTGRAFVDRWTIHVPDLAVESDTEYPEGKVLQQRFGHHTMLATPLLREGVPLGVIVILRTEVRAFSDKQVKLLETFAAQAVIAIENVRLFQELQARTQDLARSVEQLQALGAVGQAVSSTLDLETVLTTIVSRADLLAGADGGAIYEFDEAESVFRRRATQGFDPTFVEATRSASFALGEGAVGRAGITRQAVEIPDISDPGAYESRLRDAMTGSGLRAVLAVPLVREGRLLGGLVVARKNPGRFGPEVVDLLKTLAAQSAIAIQNARLFSELGEKGRELEAASRHKSEFLANMSHELRTPLNAIIGFSEVLGERMFGELNDKQAEYIQDILSSGRHLLALINDILDLSKIEAGRMELELSRFDLPAAIGGAVILVRERATRHGLTLDVTVDDQIGPFVGDERKIRQVLLNLLSNAVKFTPEGGRVAVRAAPANGSVEISVSDTGIGIAPEDQEAIFQEFRQVGTDYARKREGTGLGLALARRFVALHGGRIWVKSRLGEGSTFTFTLPVRPWPAS
jgi:signal transduction histidine kinase